MMAADDQASSEFIDEHSTKLQRSVDSLLTAGGKHS